MAGAGLALVLVGTVVACGGSEKSYDLPHWPAVADPQGATMVSWSQGSVIYRADGSKVDVGRPVEAYVAAGGGYLAVVDSEGSEEPPGNLYHASLAGEVEPVGAFVHAQSFNASPDGRFFAYLDSTLGERDEHDVAVKQMVVVDLRAGKELVRSSEGMGDPEEDDLGADYENHPVGFAGITDQIAYFYNIHQSLGYALPSGKKVGVPEEGKPWEQPETVPEWNPAHTWRLLTTGRHKGKNARIESADGRQLTPRIDAEHWNIVDWVDDDTWVGRAVRGPGTIGDHATASRRTWSLFTCDVPDLGCRTLPGSEFTENDGSIPKEPLNGIDM